MEYCKSSVHKCDREVGESRYWFENFCSLERIGNGIDGTTKYRYSVVNPYLD